MQKNTFKTYYDVRAYRHYNLKEKSRRKFGTITINKNYVYVKILSTINLNTAHKTHFTEQSHLEADRGSEGQ
jgi:hypothetical protein